MPMVGPGASYAGQVTDSPVSPPAGASAGRAAVVYTLARLTLFLLVVLVLNLLTGLSGLPLAAVALLVSSVVGYLVLRRQRDALAEAVAARSARREAEQAALRARLDEQG